MVIGDGILTPCISDSIVWISAAILVGLFMVQRFGAGKVGYTFAPILCIWFLFISGIGVYNFIKYDPTVLKALNPKYIIDYFKRNSLDAWISLGGVILATTGAEALFADLGHFSVWSIQISMCCVVYPSITIAYIGQASFLRKNNDLVGDTFYKSIPGPVYWPMFVVSVLAAIIASQSLISDFLHNPTIPLSRVLPLCEIVHTSPKYAGQVYVPEVNYILMLACLGVTLGFRTTAKIGNAFGIAVVFVMSITSCLLVLIMIMVWKSSLLYIIGYVVVIGFVELIYLSSVLYKFKEGGYLPLAFATILMAIMLLWNYVYKRKYYYELNNKISPERLKEIATNEKICRIPGLAMFYSELVQGIPPIFEHYVKNVPAMHSVLIFVSKKSLPISSIPVEERFLFRRIDTDGVNVYRCVARYGYRDARSEEEPFEKILIERLKDFIREDLAVNEGERLEAVAREIEVLDQACFSGVVYLIGESEVVAKQGSNLVKKIVIDQAYNFMKKNLRQSNMMLDIPHARMLKVGMIYEL
ncbi:K_trans domain-containing protein [Cephalotus follicularis]|uniref:Potassium transporter n=1 Tax=Cephalotus follicularis TaxID=3775 RepID=A0A1Q3D688_CEPFO|nr:K_trans domain-containing protein [Cephalotus follicularis]